MKLSKRERYETYVRMYNRIASYQSTFLCLSVIHCNSKIHRKLKEDIPCSKLAIQMLPELALFGNSENGWWTNDYNGRKERLTALGFMMAMTEGGQS